MQMELERNKSAMILDAGPFAASNVEVHSLALWVGAPPGAPPPPPRPLSHVTPSLTHTHLLDTDLTVNTSGAEAEAAHAKQKLKLTFCQSKFGKSSLLLRDLLAVCSAPTSDLRTGALDSSFALASQIWLRGTQAHSVWQVKTRLINGIQP